MRMRASWFGSLRSTGSEWAIAARNQAFCKTSVYRLITDVEMDSATIRRFRLCYVV
jgi:hypothetical protein